MPILGLMGTGDFAADQRPLNWRETILRLKPRGKYLITALSSMMRGEATDDPQFHWWQDVYEARHMALTAALLVVAPGTVETIDVDKNALYTRKHTLIRVPGTGEVMKVNSDPTIDTQVEVIRGYAGVAPAAAAIGDQATIIGTAFPEGAGSPKGVQTVPTKLFNYTQIFKEAVEHTRTQSKTATRTSPEQVEWDRMKALERHMEDIERAVLFGVKSEQVDPGNGKPVRTTDGLLSVITTNVQDFGGAPTIADLNDYFEQLFTYGEDTRIAVCGNRFLNKLNQLILNNVQYKTEEPMTVYGMKLTELVTPFGSVFYNTHPLLTTDPAYTNAALLLSPENMVYRYIDDTMLKENVQGNDEDLKKDQWLTECGFEFHHEQTFGLMTNL